MADKLSYVALGSSDVNFPSNMVIMLYPARLVLNNKAKINESTAFPPIPWLAHLAAGSWLPLCREEARSSLGVRSQAKNRVGAWPRGHFDRRIGPVT